MEYWVGQKPQQGPSCYNLPFCHVLPDLRRRFITLSKLYSWYIPFLTPLLLHPHPPPVHLLYHFWNSECYINFIYLTLLHIAYLLWTLCINISLSIVFLLFPVYICLHLVCSPVKEPAKAVETTLPPLLWRKAAAKMHHLKMVHDLLRIKLE